MDKALTVQQPRDTTNANWGQVIAADPPIHLLPPNKSTILPALHELSRRLPSAIAYFYFLFFVSIYLPLPWHLNIDAFIISMEPTFTKRVGDSSSSRPRPPRQQTPKFFAESPPSLPRSSRKKRRRRRESPSAEYYSIRRVLEEKTERGEIKVLIDWEDNLETGESYTPTWVWIYTSRSMVS